MSHDMVPSRLMATLRHLAVANLVALTLAFALLAQTAAPASASIGWCRSDPVVLIDLVPADVFVSAQWEDLGKISGATQVVIVMPTTVKTSAGVPTIGFGYGEQVSFERSNGLRTTWSGVQLRIKVRVPSSDNSVPIRVEFAPRLIGIVAPVTVEGHANSWITFNAVL
jgi:hypothetical protein